MSAIDGLIAAVVAGPVEIPAQTWLPHVFGGSRPQTRPGSIEERLVNTVLNRHDEVESLLRDAPGHYYPIFMNHKGETIVGPWAIGFSPGLSLGGEAWAPILLAMPKPVIAPIMAVNPQLAKLLIRISPQERRKMRVTAHHHISSAVLQLHAITRKAR